MAANTEYLDLYEQEIQGQYIAPDRNKHIFGVKQHEDQTGVFFGPDYNYRTNGDYHRPDEDTPEQSFVLQSVQRNYTPTESEQTETVVAEVGYDGLQKVEVSIDAIPSTYVGSNVTKKQGSTITPSTQQQIAVPANNYTLDDVIVNAIPNQYIIPTGTKEIEITTNGTSIENIATYSNAEIEVNVPNSYSVEDEGKVVSNGALTSQTSATYTSNNTYNTTTVNSVTVNVPTGSEPILQSLVKNYTPTESSQSEDITPESDYDGLSQVRINVGAISSTYVGSQISRKSSSDLTQNGATVTAPAGYYQSAASKTVASGAEGTPVATKGTVSNHAISVTPSVTNTAGYIAGGTKTGTAVTVSASQLVSGAKQISSNGTNIDVTNYATVNVSVEGGSGGDSGSIGQIVQDANGYLVISPESSNGAVYQDANGALILSEDGEGSNVPATYVLPEGTKQIIQNGTGIDVADFALVDVNVPNSYSASDEGKVVSNGALIVQISDTVTANNTYDTTLINSLTVNVSGVSIDDLATNTAPSGAITLSSSVTQIGELAFAGKPVTSVTGTGVTKINGNAFNGSSIVEITDSNFPSLNEFGASACVYMSSLKRVYLTGAKAYLKNFYTFQNNNNSIKVARFPNCTGGTNQQNFGSCYQLKVLDLGPVDSIAVNFAYNARGLQTLILRKTTVCAMANVSAFANTPLRGYNGLSATVYIPKALYDHLGDESSSDYRAATNWSTIYNDGHITFAQLEGSPYEQIDWDDSSFLS